MQNPTFKPYRLPSGGWGSARSVGNILRREGVLASGPLALTRHNKVDGYQCNSCAWVKPASPLPFEFCENGVKAVAWELTAHRCTPQFFAEHTVTELLGWDDYHLPNASKLSRTGDGFVALGVTCLTYGIVQFLDGYGFVGVFAAALALRSSNHGDAYHRKMHDYAEELERLMMMVLLVGFGAALVGGLLAGLTWPVAGFVVLALLVVRPAIGWIGLASSSRPADERAVIAFFGIRGLGTVYYLAYAFGHARFEAENVLWATVGLTVLVSIVMHGITVTPVLRLLDRRSGRDTSSAQLDLTLVSPSAR